MSQDAADGLMGGAGQEGGDPDRRQRTGDERRAAHDGAVGEDEGRDLIGARPDRAQALELVAGLVAHPADDEHEKQGQRGDPAAGHEQQTPRGSVGLARGCVQPAEAARPC